MRIRRTARWLRRATALGVVVTVMACTASEDPAPPAGQSPTAPGARAAVDEAGLDDEVVDAVTSAGIRVVAADGSTAYGAEAPYSGLDVSEGDLASLVAQAESGSGTLGSDLDAVVPTEVPLSAFVVGYVRGAKTDAAHLAADYLGEQDLTHPQDVVFPALVPLLFAADLAHAAGDPDATEVAPSAFHAASPCTGVSQTIKNGINAIFDALHIDYVDLPKTGVSLLDDILQGMADLVVDGVNVVIEAGRRLVIGIVEFLLDEVFAIVGKVAAVAAMIGQFLEYVRPVKLLIEFSPTEATKGIAPNPNRVEATLTASTDLGFGPVDWPEWFVGCAAEAGQTLPPLKPEGEKVDWSLSAPADLVHEVKPAGPVLVNGGPGLAKSTWQLETGTEPPGLTGQLVSTSATFTAAVERSKVRELLLTVEQMARNWLTGKLPDFIRKPLNAAIDGAAATLIKGLVKATEINTTRKLLVSYHEDDKPKPPKSKHELWAGDWVNPGYGSSGTFTLDVRRSTSRMTGDLQVFGADCIQSGDLQAVVDGDQVSFGLIRGGIDQISFQGVIEGHRVVGVWSVTEACGGWTGSWQATITRPKAG